ncbi:DUF930 domain-containing protein [Neorhizobium galegae]|uniref:DUF930 domain-containing protein n=1 Tax=Neorhizobium galegae TaxID=399 RepID=UPI00062217E6|nr:DUF930 domain-containing protein [Neorhizobium galegae]MCQ1765662.1 DUF930 domain-containing protein [Neorhizobium galegae]MCQ1844576.1 DUF930 domain-containing protein [Neorhizobium galegae]CDZ39080.1 Mll3619 protein [Neorhizobium galegae bv. officinalis]
MTDLPGKPRGDIGWGIPASILVHVVFVAALFFHLPVDQSEPEREESVQVEIVPPPEEPEKKREEQKAEEKKPVEEAKPEEKKPPEPAKQEEAKKAEPPPPPPEPPKQEEAKKQEPPPAAPEEKAVEPPPSADQAKGQPLPVLRPVFEFGEKDGGPKKSETGNASKETTNPPAESKADAQAVEPVKQAKEAPTIVEAPPANPVPDDIQLPEVGIAAANGLQNAPVAGTSPDATKTEIVTAPPAASPKSDPSKTPTAAKPVELTEAKTLFSQSETDDPVATTAMRNVPRGVRAGQLCATELREQLRHSAQAYRPEMLPAYRLPSGTVLEVKRGAFRANAQWYDLSFRCEVDDDATKIVSFAFDIGAPVPQSEWRRRGFPEL